MPEHLDICNAIFVKKSKRNVRRRVPRLLPETARPSPDSERRTVEENTSLFIHYLLAIGLSLVFFLTPCLVPAQDNQVIIPRIEQMPNEPRPFNVRDWREVAVQYDSFVYDLDKTGQYLPLVSLRGQGYNYPQQPGFQLVTYVGTNRAQSNEAINVLPSLVGATLAGVDKSNHYGQNWVLMSQDFFNRQNGENIYLNNVNGGSGNDWWYDLMPNLFFYQLYDLYPGIGGDAGHQFTSVADRFAEAVRAMGGNDAPWSKAFMNYRAWDFLDMQPNDSGVKEPEAAGAYAWVLYHAYKRTGRPEYRKAAEWSMEFLSEWDSNPSYELQLPYGTYVAAKMNAELGTDYDIEKMVNWSFNRGPLRGWGTIVGNWNGFDVSGLVGEANDNGNDYAFQLNGVQQAAALVPMVRYDKRFARPIGKWVLNLANATRLFFPGFLPAALQDASEWSETYDPQRVMGYEALRERWEGKSPFSTGDALRGGWAETNLSLYSTSSIGYLGGMIDQTEDDKILQIDLLKTDFYRDDAYPTYLFFNPYDTERSITLETGNEAVDIYEMLSETFIERNVNGSVELRLPPDEAVVVVLTPPAGEVSYEYNRMLVDGVVVDYGQSREAFHYPPRLQALAAARDTLEVRDSITIYSSVDDRDSENFTYEWSLSGGDLREGGDSAVWQAPEQTGTYEVRLIVSDETGLRDTATLQLTVVAEINRAPRILEILKGTGYVAPGEQLELSCSAEDANGDPLTYSWSAEAGALSGSGVTVDWSAPDAEGIYEISVEVKDDKGAAATAATTILVRDFTPVPGRLLAYYPFSGNAEDASDNQLDGSVFGARLTTDREGMANSAYRFDGINDRISVANAPVLNVENAISVSCWINPSALPDREMFILSHGSWQNRWKVSVIPDRLLRWTVNTRYGIADLDSETILAENSFYHLTATYDGELLALYINGRLESFRNLSGRIRTSSLPLLIGQMLPGDEQFNFPGVIDEVRLFDYALTPAEATELYNQELTTSITPARQSIDIRLSPNPVREQLYIHFAKASDQATTLTIYDLNGKMITRQRPGDGQTILEISTGDWPAGLYLLRVQSREGTGIARFVVQ